MILFFSAILKNLHSLFLTKIQNTKENKKPDHIYIYFIFQSRLPLKNININSLKKNYFLESILAFFFFSSAMFKNMLLCYSAKYERKRNIHLICIHFLFFWNLKSILQKDISLSKFFNYVCTLEAMFFGDRLYIFHFLITRHFCFSVSAF